MENLRIKRYELKYYISKNDYYILISRLRHVLRNDPYSIPYKGYTIRSLYFDSYDDECLYEKLAGILYRKKYRIRLYNLKTDVVKFEIKNKFNNQIFKESAVLSLNSAYKVIEGEYDELLRYNNPILRKIYKRFIEKHYKPKVLLEYDRDAFIFDFFNVRITIDKDLRSNNSNFDLCSENIHMIPVILENKYILEIKFNSVLPEFIKKIIQIDSCERYAISKYVLARKYFKIHKWEDY